MGTIMNQSNMSGVIGFLPYRYLLTSTLTDKKFTVDVVTHVLIDIDIGSIKEVKLVRNIFMFGIKIRYYHKKDFIKVISLRTRKYKDWGHAFRSVGVVVLEHGGWFEFDILDYFRQ